VALVTVVDTDASSGERERRPKREPARYLGRVAVADDGGRRSHRAEFLENGQRNQIACVNDVMDASQRGGERLRQARQGTGDVRVSDEADAVQTRLHGFSLQDRTSERPIDSTALMRWPRPESWGYNRRAEV
jgi:hypothetical protein